MTPMLAPVVGTVVIGSGGLLAGLGRLRRRSGGLGLLAVGLAVPGLALGRLAGRGAVARRFAARRLAGRALLYLGRRGGRRAVPAVGAVETGTLEDDPHRGEHL